MSRIAIRPELLRWACERAGYSVDDLVGRVPGLRAWERGEKQPTVRQLEDFAKATHVPLGYLFLPAPPEERVPIPDFRTIQEEIRRPSPDLLDTIYGMQRRQAWLREERMEYETEPLDFVGSARLTDDPDAVGREMRRLIGIGSGWAAGIGTWMEAVGELRKSIERAGVMAVVNGVVGNNTHRKLDVEEFRGFSLCDAHAPLIFVNGADAKSAQMFTLAHELAHTRETRGEVARPSVAWRATSGHLPYIRTIQNACLPGRTGPGSTAARTTARPGTGWTRPCRVWRSGPSTLTRKTRTGSTSVRGRRDFARWTAARPGMRCRWASIAAPCSTRPGPPRSSSIPGTETPSGPGRR